MTIFQIGAGSPFFVSFFYFKNIEADFGEGSRICKAIPMAEILLIKKVAR